MKLPDKKYINWSELVKNLIDNKELLMFLVLIFLIYIWNAFNIQFGSGYDEIGHTAYIRNIVISNKIPHPLSGWATFHPPFYYTISSYIWLLFEQFGQLAIISSIRILSGLSFLVTGISAYFILKNFKYSKRTILLSISLLLSMPVVMLSASWIGNEALSAGISSVACVAIVSLALNPNNAKLAIITGILCGLAFSTKYTGLFMLFGLISAAVDVANRNIRLRILLISLIGFFIISAPVLIRNVHTTGTLLPMTRNLEAIAKHERVVHVDRSLMDYVAIPFKCITEPTLFKPDTNIINTHMKSVWGLTYASIWYDPFGHRLPDDAASGLGRLILILGLCPTLIMLYGMFDTLRDMVNKRLDQAWIPLLVMSFFGLMIYVKWTWDSATLVAVKGSYLMPLLIPATAFFARGFNKACSWFRSIATVCCVIVIVAIVATYTEGVIYRTPLKHYVSWWRSIAEDLPYSGIRETIMWWEMRYYGGN